MNELENLRLRLRSAQRDVVYANPTLLPIRQHSPELFLENGKPADSSAPISGDEWVVTYEVHRTRKLATVGSLIFEDRVSAEEFKSRLSDSVFVLNQMPNQPEIRQKVSFIQDLLDRKAVKDSEPFKTEMQIDLVRDVLEIDGVIADDGSTSLEVLETLGQQRIDRLEALFSDSWPIVAQMEFVMRQRSTESAP